MFRSSNAGSMNGKTYSEEGHMRNCEHKDINKIEECDVKSL